MRARNKRATRPELGRYTAVYEHDDEGSWTVAIRELPDCRAHGDNLAQARKNMRKSLALWVDDAQTAEVDEELRPPASARRALDAYRKARDAAARAKAAAAQRSRETARQLCELGLSMRDAAELMGLSQQRVAQLTAE